MLNFALRRLARALLTILIVVASAFIILRATSDPALVVLGPDAPPKAVAAFRAAWGLDKPLLAQFAFYLRGILHGEFGRSMLDGEAVLPLVLSRVLVTLEIMAPALLLGILTGVCAGIWAALNRGRFLDRLLMFGSVAGFAVPGFVLGLILVLIFAVRLHWLPAGGDQSWRSAILPILTLSTSWSAILARFTRSSMIDVLDQPYILTGSAKGLLWRQVIMRHALPNAAIPVVTMIGFMVGGLLAGAVVTESVFSWPGLGQLIVTSVASRDVSVVQCVLILVATTMVLANMLVDLLYGCLDPRMRISTT
ncbi:ABC transporter permease [Martelella alba]|uniref:ABC transporter permease n=1 Tax=Martelella alba TaxID=2590451 RepID=A0ABY2SH59_9HYPH|nr:ABC transporter permease [Martelella alba]TKI03953.1 ABC transporter permease [Martelella alba]